MAKNKKQSPKSRTKRPATAPTVTVTRAIPLVEHADAELAVAHMDEIAKRFGMTESDLDEIFGATATVIFRGILLDLPSLKGER